MNKGAVQETKHRSIAERIPELLLALITVILAANLIVQALAIYRDGVSAANQTEAGVRIAAIYSPEIIRNAAARSGLQWMLWGWLICLAAVVLFRFFRPAPPIRMRGRVQVIVPASEQQGKRRVLRTVLYVAAGAMLLLGVWNGGMRDVLVKAVNICTECVGLG